MEPGHPQWQTRNEAPSLPPFEYAAWTETPSQALLAAKKKIEALEEVGKWELLKKMVNPYEMVHTHEDPEFHPSLASIKPLSRSFFKMIEMLRVLEWPTIGQGQTGAFRTAHVAEGPGGFIQAITTLLQRHPTLSLEKAMAMTLKPTDKRVPGWRRATSFLHHHREVRLHYGIDNTGDIYQQGNQDSFVEACAPGAHLFTADGGFDFSINYEIQEQRVFHLLVCSATIGLRSLSKGGSFVLKVFDLFSPASRILVTLIARHFKEWMLYKPALSRPCNSECYLLGRGFRGMRQETLQLFLTLQNQSMKELYPVNEAAILTPAESAYFAAHTKKMITSQLRALSRAEHYAQHPEHWFTDQIQRDFQTSIEWCQRYQISTLFESPLPLTCPSRLLRYTSEPGAAPQSQSPGDG